LISTRRAADTAGGGWNTNFSDSKIKPYYLPN